ncbi:SpoIIIAH-like family protein, partial [Oscillospiraceae bacterium OttesenSCG-928-F05]|nr:SpoIIIAH-like family protein [Oscillospiraceae bacterium OttesenSCG-928-F05]
SPDSIPLENNTAGGEADPADNPASNPGGEAQTPTSQDNYFDQARLTRQQARDSALTILKSSSENTEVSQETRDSAIAEVNQMASDALKEAQIENLVLAKGYTACVAFINGDGINVVVSAPEGGLQKNDVAKITDIVKGETSLTTDKIQIVEVQM